MLNIDANMGTFLITLSQLYPKCPWSKAPAVHSNWSGCPNTHSGHGRISYWLLCAFVAEQAVDYGFILMSNLSAILWKSGLLSGCNNAGGPASPAPVPRDINPSLEGHISRGIVCLLSMMCPWCAKYSKHALRASLWLCLATEPESSK